jgi:hypothetical protein
MSNKCINEGCMDFNIHTITRCSIYRSVIECEELGEVLERKKRIEKPLKDRKET